MVDNKRKNILEDIFGENNRTVLISMLILMVVIIAAGLLVPQQFAEVTNNLTSSIVKNLGWWLSICTVIFAVFSIGIAFTKYGNIKLGKDDDKPEYSFSSWFAMLFSCGLGVALYYSSVTEPITHYMQPPYLADPQTPQAASLGLQIANLHLGIATWGTFAIVGLVIAYFAYRKDKPFSITSGLYGLMGDKAYGKFGSVVDFLTVFATLGGVATSVGIGVLQLRYGASWISGYEVSDGIVAILFVVLLLLYTITAVSGVNKGIKHLSNANMYLAYFILGFIFIFGPRVFQLNIMVQSTGDFIKNLPQLISFTDPTNSADGWTRAWSMFYYCWIISWAPFVGGFVARISKGRTIREFIIGVLGAPILFTIVWFGIFGGTALHAQMSGVDIWGAMQIDGSAGIYALFETLPFSKILGALMFINLLTFLATSANTAAYFSAVIVSKGNQKPKARMIILWALSMGLVGIVLMFTGGLVAVQSGAIASAFIFSIIIVLMIFSFVKTLKKENL